MGAVGGARQKEIPTKGILAVKIKTKRKKILSAIPEIRPDNISLPPKKKNIIFNFSEEVRIWESLWQQELGLDCGYLVQDYVTSNTDCDHNQYLKVLICLKAKSEEHFSSKQYIHVLLVLVKVSKRLSSLVSIFFIYTC